MLSSRLRLSLPSSLFPSDFSYQNPVKTFPLSHKRCMTLYVLNRRLDEPHTSTGVCKEVEDPLFLPRIEAAFSKI